MYQKKHFNKECANCNKPFITSYSKQKYCCPDCLAKGTNEENYSFRTLYPNLNITTAQVGYVSLMKVCIDLIFKEYEVFTSIHEASCDIIALKNNKMVRIEVKTGYFRNSKFRTGATKHQEGKYDIFAAYDPKHDKVIYSPKLS